MTEQATQRTLGALLHILLITSNNAACRNVSDGAGAQMDLALSHFLWSFGSFIFLVGVSLSPPTISLELRTFNLVTK
jgi:hypothetical protein